MDYRITGSNLTVKATDLPIGDYGNIYSDGINNTIYLKANVSAAPGGGNNYIYGIDKYNLLQYFFSPKGIVVDAVKGEVINGYGGIDTFTGISGFQGSGYADYFKGSTKDEIFYTGGGADTVIGGGGYDRVTFYSALSTDYEITFNVIENSFKVKPKGSASNEIDTYFDIDEIEFGDKSIINPNSLGIAKNARIIGYWLPIDVNDYTATYHPSLANTFWGNPKFGTAGLEGMVGIGWAYSGFDNKSTSVTKVNSILIEQLSDGNLKIVNSDYLSSSKTNGGGSVVIADMNGDKKDDIVLLAHNESPFVSASSTVYMSNSNGKFDLVNLADSVMAHDAEFIHPVDTSQNAIIVTKSFGATDNVYQFSNGTISFSSAPNIKNAGGMSIAVADLNGDGKLEAVIGDVMLSGTTPNGADKFYIGVYGFDGKDIDSSTPQKVLVPYMTSRADFSEISSEWGKGVSHTYRVWIDDFNQDGKPDILAGTSMWSQQNLSYPSMLQMFQNNGNLNFSDVTDTYNKDFPSNSAEIGYNLQIKDIDSSGISTYFSSGPTYEGASRQQNFILLNDGTGMMHEYLRSEFNQYLLDAQIFAKQAGYTNVFGGSGKFHAYLTADNKISFVVEIQVTSSTVNAIDGRSVDQYLLVQLPTNFSPTIDFKENIEITNRNSSQNIRTWAGNDTISDSNSSITATRLDGGLGFDTTTYSATSSQSTLSYVDGHWVVKKNNVSGFSDTLTNIEKLQFTDRSVFIESQSHVSYSDLPTELYQFFITAFNAAPGVTYMDQLAEAYRYGLSVKKIVDIFTTKSQFTDVYSPSLSHTDMATQLVNNIVKNSATTAAKTEAIADIKAALDIGWTVGDVIYTVFGNLAHKSLTDTNWGNTAKQFNNEITVAKYYTETLNQSTTDLETLRDVIQPVTQTTNVSSDTVVAQLIGVALMTGGQGT